MEPTSMSGRHRRHDEQDVLADDAFLTSLSRGVDPSDGADELASLLLGLRDEVEAPMPDAPLIDEAVAPVAPVTSLTERRAARDASRRFRTSPWMAGLVGAAAATVAVVGTGAALYNATPDSALWGPSQAVFGERQNVVELATKLDEIENMTESGNLAGAKQVIDQLRESMKLERGTTAPRETVVVAPEPEQPAPPAPSTVTVTAEPTTVTVVVTEQPKPSEGATPSSSTAPSTTRPSSSATTPTTTISLAPGQSDQSSQ